MKAVSESLDVIIVGAGHNGLVTAASLARAGYRVSTASYLSSLMQEKVVRDLELERFGYHVDAKDPAFFSPFPNGSHLFMWQDRTRTLAEIAKFSTHDAEV